LAGLDVGPLDLRWVELGRHPQGHLTLLRHACEPLVLGDGPGQRLEAVRAALRKLTDRFAERGLPSCTYIAMALPDEAVWQHPLALPAHWQDAQRWQAARSWAPDLLPWPVEQTSLDIGLLEVGPQEVGHLGVGRQVPSLGAPAEPGMAQACLVAARRDDVQALQALSESAGLSLAVLEMASTATARGAAGLSNIDTNLLGHELAHYQTAVGLAMRRFHPWSAAC
jgi:Tfp pilus assembly PilM family ATPase